MKGLVIGVASRMAAAIAANAAETTLQLISTCCLEVAAARSLPEVLG